MANSPQNPKDSKKRIFSSVWRHFSSGSKSSESTNSHTPAEGHGGRSSKREFLGIFKKNSDKDTVLGSSIVPVSDSKPPHRSSPSPASPGSHSTATFRLVQDLDTLSPPEDPITTSSFDQPTSASTSSPAENMVETTPETLVSSSTFTPGDHSPLPTSPGLHEQLHSPTPTTTSGQSLRPAGNTADTKDNSQIAKPTAESSLKENIKLTGRALQTLIKKATDIVDDNPVKIALGLATAIIEISRAVKDNKDAVANRIALAGGHLMAVETALRKWDPANNEGIPHLNQFAVTMQGELEKLAKLRDESNFRKFIDYEGEQAQIEDIFVRINEARVQLELALGIRVFKAVYEIDQTVRKLLLDLLNYSNIADHKYKLEGKQGQLLRRQVCTPGTRIAILDDITIWAMNSSSDSPNVYWLFGHAGSGKTTIAYTIARRFEFAGDSTDTIILGGNFFCSRQFEETNLSKYIIRTIVYHLALKCKPFADSLNYCGRFDTINQDLDAQLDGLLFGPWQESEPARLSDNSIPHNYLIVIDALDEIDGEGGSEFLRVLIDTINKSDEKCLNGLKFFITSRSDQRLVAHVNSLQRKQLYRLQDVKPEEAYADVATYLNVSLPHFVGRPEMSQLMVHAGGLFIYAATVVKRLEGRRPLDQKNFLTKLFSTTDASQSSLQDPELLLNRLYTRILVDYFGGFQEEELDSRLLILYTFLCAKEPLSTTAVSSLLFPGDPEENNPEFFYLEIANEVLVSLNSVLYVSKHGQVLSYHKSFPDFIFDKARSGRFWCDRVMHERRLTYSCFRVMEGLRFNLANILSSFILDRDNPALEEGVKRNISPTLSYACRSWDHHLSLTKSTPSNTFEIKETLSDFLQIRILFWIEAMNLLNTRWRCYAMLQAARDWISTAKDDSLLAQHLAEAMAFAMYFSGSPASLSTPHLYISALATWPRNFDPCRGWKRQFPTIPQFTNASTGGTVLMTLNVGTAVKAVAFSHDGSRIVSGSWDGFVQVWDVLTGKEELRLEGHTNLVTSVDFSGDDSHIVSGSDDGSVRIWDALTGKEVHVLQASSAIGYNSSGNFARGVTSVAFSSNGNCIVSGSGDRSIRIWDALMGNEKQVLQGHADEVYSVAISSDGSRIVSGSCDHSVRVWDALTGKEERVLVGHRSSVESVAFSGDGSRIASGSRDKSVRIWDTLTGNEQHTLWGHSSEVVAVAFLSDGSRVVSSSQGKSVIIWDALTGIKERVLEGHTYGVNSVGFSSDGSHIVSGSSDYTVRIWDALTHKEEHLLQGHTEDVYSVAYSSDSSHIVTGSGDNSVRIWDALTGKEQHMLQGHTDRVTSAVFSSDKRHIISGSWDNSLRIWNALTGKEEHALWGHTNNVVSVAFSSDGSRVVSGSWDKSVRIWDALKGKEEHTLWGHTDAVVSVAFSSDGSHTVSGSWDHSVRIWDASTGKEEHSLWGHQKRVISVSFSGNGTRILSGSEDQSVRIWDALTGNQEYVLLGNAAMNNIGAAFSVMFSSDFSHIISGYQDRSIRIRNVLTGEEEHVLRGHTDWVYSAVFSSDGDHILSGSRDHSIRVWDLTRTPGNSGEEPVLEENLSASSSFSSDGSGIALGPETKLVGRMSTATRASRYIREDDGWLLSPHGEGYLMFVPPSEQLPDDSNILIIPESFVSYVDFTTSTLGLEWVRCYSP